jgi:hypothetical protein
VWLSRSIASFLQCVNSCKNSQLRQIMRQRQSALLCNSVLTIDVGLTIVSVNAHISHTLVAIGANFNGGKTVFMVKRDCISDVTFQA